MSTCYFPPGYKVRFDGDDLGDTVHAYLSGWKLATPEAIRHNFWAGTPTIDVTYPALVWEHNFTVYMEKPTRGQYVKGFMDVIRTCVASRARHLMVVQETTNRHILSFGMCNFVASEQETPENFLMHAAGLFRVRFLGTAIPSLVSSY